MTDQQDRLTRIVAVLSQRGRHAWAARLHGAWLQALASDPDADQPGTTELRRQGNLLRSAGDHANAANAFGAVIRRYLRDGDTKNLLFRHALIQLAASLEAAGSLKSAAETRRLLVRFDAKRNRETAIDELTSLQPARLLVSCMGRALRTLELNWDGELQKQAMPEADPPLECVRGRFRSSPDSMSWIEFHIEAPAHSDASYPYIEACARFESIVASAETTPRILALVNDVNLGNTAVSCCWDPESARITIRVHLAFSGFNEAGPDLDVLDSAHHEASYNLVLNVILTALGVDARVSALRSKVGFDSEGPR